MFTSFIPLILIFVIFYFLLIRPQQKKGKTHREFLDNLQKDAAVVNDGGIHGKIVGIADSVITLEVAKGVRIKLAKGHIAGVSEVKDIIG